MANSTLPILLREAREAETTKTLEDLGGHNMSAETLLEAKSFAASNQTYIELPSSANPRFVVCYPRTTMNLSIECRTGFARVVLVNR